MAWGESLHIPGPFGRSPAPGVRSPYPPAGEGSTRLGARLVSAPIVQWMSPEWRRRCRSESSAALEPMLPYDDNHLCPRKDRLSMLGIIAVPQFRFFLNSARFVKGSLASLWPTERTRMRTPLGNRSGGTRTNKPGTNCRVRMIRGCGISLLHKISRFVLRLASAPVVPVLVCFWFKCTIKSLTFSCIESCLLPKRMRGFVRRLKIVTLRL